MRESLNCASHTCNVCSQVVCKWCFAIILLCLHSEADPSRKASLGKLWTTATIFTEENGHPSIIWKSFDGVNHHSWTYSALRPKKIQWTHLLMFKSKKRYLYRVLADILHEMSWCDNLWLHRPFFNTMDIISMWKSIPEDLIRTFPLLVFPSSSKTFGWRDSLTMFWMLVVKLQKE